MRQLYKQPNKQPQHNPWPYWLKLAGSSELFWLGTKVLVNVSTAVVAPLVHSHDSTILFTGGLRV
eukprot:7200292-Prorocentrum_lima.AAC.1